MTLASLPSQSVLKEPADPFALARRLRTPVWVFDTDHSRIAYANEAACALWKAGSEEELTARDLSAGMSATVASRLRQYQRDFSVSNAVFSEFWTLYPHGEPTPVSVIYTGFVMPDGRMAMMCEATGQADATPETLRSAEALLHTDVMITLYAIDGTPLYANPAARNAMPSLSTRLPELFCDPDIYAEMQGRWDAEEECRRVAQIETANGPRWHDMSVKCRLDAATGQQALLVTAIDVSELKTARDQARYLADRDQLTGCYNRAFFTQQLAAISAEVAHKKDSHAILFLDIDKFKQVNDQFGHAVGDIILRTFAQRIQSKIRQTDIIARIGGDEFVVLIEDVRDTAALQNRLKAIQSEVLKPIDCGAVVLNITTSIGASMINAGSARNSAEILRQADIALYYSKRAGRNRHTVFNDELGDEVSEQNWLETELKRAVKARDFTLHFQPRIDVRSGTVVSAEVLLRWKHAERGFIPPSEFIPIGERLGLIDELGAFVLNESFLQLKRWRAQGLTIGLSVNVSPLQFQDPGLVDLYRAIAGDTATPASGIELEITESSLLGDNPHVYDKIREITDMGFRVALDDFGTGYSNLAHISRFPLGCIKLDKSFVQLLPSSGPLLRLILTLAKQIGAITVAEGVETQAQLDWLIDHGCDQIQGFLFSRPVPAEELPGVIAELQDR